MRTALLSVAIGVTGALGILASGWGLQAAALPAPKSADRALAGASVWLHEHRLVIDRFSVGHRRLTAACLRTWVPIGRQREAAGSLLSFGHGSAVFVTKARIVVLAGSRQPVAPVVLAAGAGCTGPLEFLLGRAAQTGADLALERAYAAHQPALALEIQRVRQQRLTLYVSPRTFRPLVTIVHAHNRTVKARLYLARVTVPLLRRFDLVGRAS